MLRLRWHLKNFRKEAMTQAPVLALPDCKFQPREDLGYRDQALDLLF
jgi:hypothetical protein